MFETNGNIPMRKLILAAALASASATPAMARDGSAYVGFDAGLTSIEKFNLRYVNVATSIAGAYHLRHKTGIDLDAVAGSGCSGSRARSGTNLRD